MCFPSWGGLEQLSVPIFRNDWVCDFCQLLGEPRANDVFRISGAWVDLILHFHVFLFYQNLRFPSDLQYGKHLLPLDQNGAFRRKFRENGGFDQLLDHRTRSPKGGGPIRASVRLSPPRIKLQVCLKIENPAPKKI